ncbi:ABC transporter ATP-binding protein [Panacibacter sp. DH6]|uniref:ABC transporter ATP-binding protein n=1 Tax=Panacibacter microcysteis TaxID=2793269 RepID=A0A931GUT0_9BACT|nr:ABC transporter ATP-binding protein [Panacibacter microcysteis]MBG9375700.1 ABC transporter ATP-binding protein [Panacibacter microcysteis]
MALTTDSIKSFIQYGDISLAVRRTLDAALDTQDDDLVTEAISWSKQYHRLQNNDENPGQDFFNKADDLITRISSFPSGRFAAMPLLNVDQIGKSYSKGNFTLHPISFEIRTGDILGVVGENGNGKTTLLSCLSGDLAIDRGNIIYHNLRKADYYTIKGHVAFIPQRIPVWYGMLKDNLHFSAALSGVKGKANELMVDFMLERLNLSSYAHLTWKQISSGYRTRFEIARVLLQKPSLLILDEPLANLDINAQQTLLTDLRNLAKSVRHPLGIVLSSQQLHEVEKVADNVLLIKKGKCIYTTNTQNESAASNAIEIESNAERELIGNVLGAEATVQYNGGFYTIVAETISAKQLLQKLVNAGIEIQYYRDITNSTKRYF